MSSPKKSPKSRSPKTSPAPVAPVIVPAELEEPVLIAPPHVRGPNDLNDMVANQGPLEDLTLSSKKLVPPKEDLDHLLLQKGFVPLGSIVIANDDGIKGKVRYIKAYDVFGNTAYIDLEEEEREVYVSPNDLTMIEIRSANTLPLATKLSALDCAKLDVCGMAFECDGGVCTIKRDAGSLESKTTSFAVMKAPQVSWGREEGLAVSYPIVKLSEVLLNPWEVSKRLEKAALRIEYQSIKAYNQEVERLAERFTNVTNVLTVLPKAMSLAERSVTSSMLKLRNISSDLRATNGGKGPLTAADKAFSTQLAYNVHLRQKYMNDLLVFTRVMNEHKMKVDRLNEDLVKRFEELKEKYNETTMRKLFTPFQ